MKQAWKNLAACTLLAASGAGLSAAQILPQGTTMQTFQPAGPADADHQVRTFYLNATVQADQNEILLAIRNILQPFDKILLVPGQSAVVISAPPQDLALVERLLRELDKPKRLYRLTYTLTEFDGDKRIGLQHYTMTVTGGQRTEAKQGDRVPLATASTTAPTSSPISSQVTYIDIGMNFTTNLDESALGARLRFKVERSSLAEERSSVIAQDPIIRQTNLEGTAFLTPGKPVELGSLDVPGSTRRIQVEVVADPMK